MLNETKTITVYLNSDEPNYIFASLLGLVRLPARAAQSKVKLEISVYDKTWSAMLKNNPDMSCKLIRCQQMGKRVREVGKPNICYGEFPLTFSSLSSMVAV